MVPQSIKPPCGPCDKHTPYCHSSCEAYKAYTDKIAAYKARRDEQMAGDVEAGAVRRAAIIKASKIRTSENKRKGRV